MTPAIRSRLTRILGMTGSAHDAEALTAIRLAAKILHDMGLTWEELIGARVPDAASPEDAVERAFEDGHRKGHHEGYEKGYAEGYAKALLASKSSPAARPRAWRAIVEELLGDHSEKITEWEEKFLQSFLYRRWHTPTPRQRDVLERIAHKCGVEVPRGDGEAPTSARPPF